MAVPARTILSIGSFDGVHVGHQALLRTAGRLAREHERRERIPAGSTRVIAMAFDPHPASVLRPGSLPPRLTPWSARARLLRDAGADQAIRLEPTPDLLGLTPEAFVDRLIGDLRPVALVEGPDFRFGKGRAGDTDVLRRLGRQRTEAEQFAVHVVEPVTVALGDQSIVTASSTVARWLIAQGRAADAARVLGRSYRIEGTVVRGDRRGRTLGYPTANVEPESMLPADGVYAALARAFTIPERPGHEPACVGTFVAAVSVGTKPQFTPGQTRRTLEAHLLDVQRPGDSPAIPGLPEYGWTIAIDLIAWLRDQQRFDGVPALVDQIERDCDRARALVDMAGTLPEAHLNQPAPRTEATGCR